MTQEGPKVGVAARIQVPEDTWALRASGLRDTWGEGLELAGCEFELMRGFYFLPVLPSLKPKWMLVLQFLVFPSTLLP